MIENKQKMTLIEMQERESKILKYLHEVCVKNGIIYYLYGGTLLGAVRHKGFIPWDDDLDVIVPRKDYEKLLCILHNQSKYRLLTNDYFEDYHYPFAKLVDPETKLVEHGVQECRKMGVWVDIFPLDATSDKIALQKLHVKLMKKLVNMNRYISADKDCIKQEINTPLKMVKFIVAKMFSSRKIIKLIHKVAKKHINEETHYSGDLTWGRHLVFPSEWFGKPVLLQFGADYYYAPSHYDALLKMTYGNYMELPPENERYSGHNYSCFKIDN